MMSWTNKTDLEKKSYISDIVRLNVYWTNILRAAFYVKVIGVALLQLDFWFVQFWRKKIGVKVGEIDHRHVLIKDILQI